MLKKLLIGFVALIVLGGCLSAIAGEDDTTDSSSSSTSENTSEDTTSGEDEAPAEKAEEKPKPEPKPKAMKVQAADMLKEFENNEAAADIKYKGKTLRITGKVHKIDTEVWDEDQYVVQMGTGKEWDFLTVNCNDMAGSDVASLNKGDTVTLIGEFDDGGDLGVEIADCKPV